MATPDAVLSARPRAVPGGSHSPQASEPTRAWGRVRLRGAGRGDLRLPWARPQYALCDYARRCPEVTPAARQRQQAPPIN